MKRSQPLKRSAPISRGSSTLKRSAMRRKRPRGQPAHKRDDGFLDFLRRQRCVSCSRPPPSHAHHPRTGAGTAIKAPDASAISLCLHCHYDLHSLAGRFKTWRRDTLRAWEARCNETQRLAYERTKAA